METWDRLIEIARDAVRRGDPGYAASLLETVPGAEAGRLRIEALCALGDDPALIEAAQRHCAEFGREAPVCRDLGLAYFRLGQFEMAHFALSAAAQSDLNCAYSAMELVPGEQRALWHQILCEALAQADPRIAQITRECAVLGRAGKSLSPRAEAIISERLDVRDASPPRWFGHHQVADADPAVPARKILLVFYGEADEIDVFSNSAVWPAFYHSAVAAGLTVASFNGRAFMYPNLASIQPTAQERHDAWQRLKAKVVEFAPDLIVLEANYAPFEKSIDQPFMDELRAQGAPILSVIFDTDHVYGVDLNFWTRNSERVLILNDSISVACAPRPDRFLRWPGVPLPASLFRPDREKDLELAFMGANYRGRLFYFLMAEALGIAPAVNFSRRPGEVWPPYSDYVQFLSRARLTLTVGTMQGNRGIRTARLFEAVLSKTVVLDEQGSGADAVFHPFLHYIPIGNVHHLVMYTQYFAKHEERRAQIAEAAHQWYLRYWHPDRFWALALAEIARTGESF